MSTYVLGINVFHADVSAVLLRDGQLVAAVEEERFRRVKHWAGFPELAVRACLDMGGIPGSRIDHVAVSRDPRANLMRKLRYVLKRRPNLRHVLSRTRNARQVWEVEDPLARALGVRRGDLPRLHYVEHHPAHLGSAFFVSPFEDATVVAIDAMGDFVSTSWARGSGSKLDVLHRTFFPHSLGILYTAVTQYLGFRSYGDEYKVMGLAPYGEPAYLDAMRRLVTLLPGGGFELALDYFRHWSDGVDMEWEAGAPTISTLYTGALERLLGPARAPGAPIEERHEDLAASLQALYEECAFHVLNGAYERVRSPRLCLAGGCGMNSVANGKIRAHTPFEQVYIQPAAADNGTALGAACHVWHHLFGNPRVFVMDHGYWGPSYPDARVEDLRVAAADDEWRYSRVTYPTEAETCRATAALLAEGLVVGWFQGGMEWGARALGNRSILADPRRADMRERINARIKLRERFRPFAPSILEEAIDDYFVGAAPDPFMQQVYPVREDRRADLPAVTHVDGSGRLQAVGRRTAPLYHRLISEFAALTGVPVLLNTSFNENEPIVDTPEQAMDCFLRTRLDAVVIHNTIVRREPHSAEAVATPDEPHASGSARSARGEG